MAYKDGDKQCDSNGVVNLAEMAPAKRYST